MVRELETAEPSGGAALANIAQADLGGAGLWLRAEPDHDPRRPKRSRRSSHRRSRMNRRHLTFRLRRRDLAGTLDDAPGDSGLLVVSGGNEIRAGAFAGQAALARGSPRRATVFRFDRRGVATAAARTAAFADSAPTLPRRWRVPRERPGLRAWSASAIATPRAR
jgi:hypothetical protein